MAQPVMKPEAEIPPSAAMPDWVEAYYTPVPANRPAAPAPVLTALEQMYAYYEG